MEPGMIGECAAFGAPLIRRLARSWWWSPRLQIHDLRRRLRLLCHERMPAYMVPATVTRGDRCRATPTARSIARRSLGSRNLGGTLT
jgi:hypothetical protein